MREFKFFKGTLDNPQMMDETTQSTASFYEEHRQQLLDVERGRIRDAETAYRFRASGAGRATGITHRDNHGNTDYNPFITSGSRQTTTNPNWRTKVKIVLQESWAYDPIGVVFVSILSTIVTIIGIAKLFGAW